MINLARKVAPADWITFALSVGVPAAVALTFARLDHGYPIGDAPVYLLESQSTYLSMKAHGLISGFVEGYLGRTFRPIIHSFLMTPVLFLTGGKILPSVSIFLVATYLFFVFYAHRLLRARFRGVELIAASWIVAFLPAVLFTKQDFAAELPLVAAYAAFLFYLNESDFFSQRLASSLSGIFLGLAICIRPPEIALQILFLGIPAVLLAHRKGHVSRKDLLLSGATAFACGGILFQQRFWFKPASEKLLSLSVALIPVAVYLLNRRKSLSPAYWRFVSWTIAIPTLWFAPKIVELYGWIYFSTFSDWAKLTGGLMKIGVTRFIVNIADYASWPVIALLLVLSGMELFRQRRYDFTGFLLLAPALLPAAIGAISNNADTKNYLLSAVAALFASMLIVGRGRKKHIIATGSKSVIAAALLLNALAMTIHRPSIVETLRPWIRGPRLHEPRSDVVGKETYATFSSPFAKLAPGTALNVGFLQLHQFNDLDGVVQPATMTLMTRESGASINYENPFPLVRDTVAEKFAFVKQHYDYVFVLPVEYKHAPLDHFMSDVAELVLDLWKKNKLASNGLIFVSRGSYVGAAGTRGEYLLLRSNERKPEIHP